jgi:DNA polymerase III sliding clamp (beta) subunit (PCNA family)
MKSEGTLGKMEPTFELGNSEAILELSCTEKSEASATYSLTMLNDIVSQCKGMSDVVILEFGSNLPLRVEFGLLCGMLEYYLAPKVEEIE